VVLEVLLLNPTGANAKALVVGEVFLAAVGVLSLALAWSAWRKSGRGPRARGVELEVQPGSVWRGERVRVNITTRVQARTIRATEVIADWQDVAGGSPAQTFEFEVPSDGPFSYEGATVSWAYRASVRRPRRLRGDPHQEAVHSPCCAAGSCSGPE
jgi:hypothetical protein